MTSTTGYTEYGDRDVAMGSEILRTVVGSGVHGIAIEGTDDHDEMGVYLEPPEYVVGLGNPKRAAGRVGEGRHQVHQRRPVPLDDRRQGVRVHAVLVAGDRDHGTRPEQRGRHERAVKWAGKVGGASQW